MLPLIALIGRPNVGKSTLFNRFTKSRNALVDDTPGLTRDRQYGDGRWGEHRFRLVDTGGFEQDGATEISVTARIREQVLVALEEADAILFVVDARAGPLPDDYRIVDLLRRSGKPFVCAVNKSEGHAGEEGVVDFFDFGVDPVMPLSAAHGLGLDAIMDFLFQKFGGRTAEEGELLSKEGGARVALIGCPNVGKSSLINLLVGENRQVISDVPGTTRDSIALQIQRGGSSSVMTLVDTAGIRRKSRVALRIEKYAVIAALKAIDRAHVAVLVLDVSRGITTQDRRIGNYAVRVGRGVIMAVNKWDLVADTVSERHFLHDIRTRLPEWSHAPVLFVSAKSGVGVQKILPVAEQVAVRSGNRFSTSDLNRWLRTTVAQYAPSRASDGRNVKIRYITQVDVHPPTLALFANRPEEITVPYQRFLENRLRDQFDLDGVPVRFSLRKGKNPYHHPSDQP